MPWLCGNGIVCDDWTFKKGVKVYFSYLLIIHSMYIFKSITNAEIAPERCQIKEFQKYVP